MAKSKRVSMADAIKTGPIPKRQPLKMRSTAEYDSLQPEKHLQEFNQFIEAVKSRHAENLRLIEDYNMQQQDLDHFAEMHEDLGRTEAARYYRDVRDIRRKRRVCKNEVALLEPIVQFYMQNKTVFDQLKQLHGRIRFAKEEIGRMDYTVKTKILDDRLGEKE